MASRAHELIRGFRASGSYIADSRRLILSFAVQEPAAGKWDGTVIQRCEGQTAGRPKPPLSQQVMDGDYRPIAEVDALYTNDRYVACWVLDACAAVETFWDCSLICGRGSVAELQM